jgi:hypothetical protein
MKIYVASSWRNEQQPAVVKALRAAGHEVYDFREPTPGDQDKGFAWSDIDPDWQEWSPELFRRSLAHPLAVNGFECDLEAMEWADAFVLVMPCGRSAHLELGWAIGRGKRAVILLSGAEPELMYRLAWPDICCSFDEVIEALR